MQIFGPLPTPNQLDTLVGQVKRGTQMKFSPYYGCHEVRSALSELLQSTDRGRMWCYNILWYNKESISHILRLNNVTVGSILITVKLVALKRENPEPILTVKINVWRKFIYCFGLIIEANPSRVGNQNIYSIHTGYISILSSVKLHISRHHLDKYFNL